MQSPHHSPYSLIRRKRSLLFRRVTNLGRGMVLQHSILMITLDDIDADLAFLASLRF